jgi:gamma-glutamylcyclotransferase (GGCT)/AIG2-like uncharacterized protein YtfP
MVDIASITTTISAIKTAKDLCAALVELRDFNHVAATVTKLNSELLKAHEGLFSLHAKVLELHQEKVEVLDKLRELEQRSEERRRYQLVELRAGSFAYRLKAPEHRQDDIAVDGDEPIHFICQQCMDVRGTRVVLRRIEPTRGFFKLDCTACSNRIYET